MRSTNRLTNYKNQKPKKKRSKGSFSVKCLLTSKCKQKPITESSKEDEQKGDEDIAELIEQIKLLDKVMKYCAKNPKECE
jgi:hypothetical protein